MSAGETPRVAVGSVPSQGHCSPSLDKRLLVSSHLRLPDRLSDAARRQGGRCHPPTPPHRRLPPGTSPSRTRGVGAGAPPGGRRTCSCCFLAWAVVFHYVLLRLMFQHYTNAG